MKKVLMVLFLMAVFAAAVFGQNYTVQGINGRVEREVSAGKWVAVKTGETLTAETVIKTGIGATLTLKSGEQTLSIGAAKNGKIAGLVSESGGIRIGGQVGQTDTSTVTRNTGRVSTASARAGDAAAEEQLVE
jgi:hypothetical protein